MRKILVIGLILSMAYAVLLMADSRTISTNLGSPQGAASVKENIQQLSDAVLSHKHDDSDGSSRLCKNFGIDSDCQVGIGTTSPDSELHVYKNSAGGVNTGKVENIDNTNASSRARFIVATGGSSSGDPWLNISNNVNEWALGLDNSDSDKFKITYNGDPSSSNQAIEISSNLRVHINPVGDADVELELSDGVTQGGGDFHRATSGAHSSRDIKSDIVYFSSGARTQAYSDVKSLRHVSFRYLEREMRDMTVFERDRDGAIISTQTIKVPTGRLIRNPNGRVRKGLILEDAPTSIVDGETITIDSRILNLELAVQELMARLERLEAR